MGDFLKPDGFVGPQGLKALAREGSIVPELARFAVRAGSDATARVRPPYLRRHRPEATVPVLLIPGFMAGDYTLAPMATMLRGAGYRTYRAHIRMNMGCTREAADRLERRLEAIALRRGKVTVVGHSLGGMLARALASRRPDLIAGIVSMGSPILAPGAVHDILARDAEMLTRLTRAGIGGLMSEDCIAGACARSSFDETHAPLDPEIGFTAIYSRRDGIVDWRACIDPAAIGVEVTASHVGMAVDPRVFDVVRSALEGQRLSRLTRADLASPVTAPNVAVRLRPAVHS